MKENNSINFANNLDEKISSYKIFKINFLEKNLNESYKKSFSKYNKII